MKSQLQHTAVFPLENVHSAVLDEWKGNLKTLAEMVQFGKPVNPSKTKEFFELVMSALADGETFKIYQFLDVHLASLLKQNVSQDTIILGLSDLRSLLLKAILNLKGMPSAQRIGWMKQILELFDNLILFVQKHYMLQTHFEISPIGFEDSELMNQIPAVLFHIEKDRFQGTGYLSPHFDILSGCQSDRFMQAPRWEELIHPEDFQNFRTLIEQTTRNIVPFYYSPYRIKTPNGTYKDVVEAGKIIYQADGEPLAFAGVILEFRERPLAGPDTKAILKTLFQFTEEYPQPVLIFSRKLELKYANQAFWKLISVPERKLLNHSIRDILKPVNGERGLKEITDSPNSKAVPLCFKMVPETQSNFKGTLPLKFVLWQITPQDTFYVAIAQTARTEAVAGSDPTLAERMQLLIEVNRQLKPDLKLNEYYKQALKYALKLVPTARAGSLLVKEKEGFAYKAAIGYPLEELQKIKLFVQPTKAVQAQSRQLAMIQQGKRMVEILNIREDAQKVLSEDELNILKKFGKIDEIRQTLSAVVYVDGKPLLLVNLDNFQNTPSFNDDDKTIIELFAQQLSANLENVILVKAIRESEQKYRQLFESSPLAIFIIQDDQVKLYNPTFLRATGLSPDEMKRIQIWDLIHPDDRTRLQKRAQRRLRGELKKTSQNLEFRARKKDGTVMTCLGTFSGIQYGGKPAILCEVVDVTRLRQLEQQLIQSQKMETLGTLTAGIAHDFNNILGAIIPSAQLILANKKSTEDKRHAEIILNMANRAAALTEQMLAFARQKGSRKEIISLNDLLDEVRDMIDNLLPKDILVKYRFDKKLPAIEGDRNQLVQMIMNLVVNGRDALTEGGKMFISTELVIADKAFVKLNPQFKTGKYVKFSVEDTGCGIPHDVLPKIFDPFYTTKEIGKGSGLGLSTVYGIVKKHGGVITVDSEVGRGTRFDIFLPASEKKPRSRAPSSERKVTRGHETILIVDDEDDLREVVSNMLTTLGYKILSAGSGKEAISLYKKYGGEIDLVMLDYAMPGMTGKQTLEVLRKYNPKLNVLLITGYGEQGAVEELSNKGGVSLLTKPFTMEMVSRKIREALR